MQNEAVQVMISLSRAAPRLYPDRTAGGDRHHRHPGGHAAAGAVKAKAKAKSINCMNNQRQCGMGVIMFADDNDDYVPPGPGVPYGCRGMQLTGYSTNVIHQGQLATYIATYVGRPAPNQTTQECNIFYCPTRLKEPVVKACYGVNRHALGVYAPTPNSGTADVRHHRFSGWRQPQLDAVGH